MNNLDSLFKPFKYKNLELKNRFVMAPMTRSFSADGAPTSEMAEYYQRRALGEVGLIITEGTVIDRVSSKNQQNIPDFYGQKALQGWKDVLESGHSEKGKIAPQLWHVGNLPFDDWRAKVPFEGPAEMTIEDIEDTIAAFAKAAKDAKDLGFDAFEIHGAHGYLIDQFFWKETNTRTDKYGGNSIKERNRFAVEVIKAMRKAVGSDFVILMRLSQWKQQDFTVKIAHTPQELEEWVLPLVEAGVDIFHGSQRRYWEPEFEGSDLNFAGWLKKVTGQPTITVGSVGLSGDFVDAFSGKGSKMTEMDQLIRRYDRGDFDLVAVGRSILQDPNWVKKVRQHKWDDLKNFDPSSIATLQ